jgi:hypothetical protein
LWDAAGLRLASALRAAPTVWRSGAAARPLFHRGVASLSITLVRVRVRVRVRIRVRIRVRRRLPLYLTLLRTSSANFSFASEPPSWMCRQE